MPGLVPTGPYGNAIRNSDRISLPNNMPTQVQLIADMTAGPALPEGQGVPLVIQRLGVEAILMMPSRVKVRAFRDCVGPGLCTARACMVRRSS